MATYTSQHARDVTYGVRFGNADGAADFDATSWTALNTVGWPIEGVVDIDPGLRVVEPARANTHRTAYDVDIIHDAKGAQPKMSFGMPATLVSLDLWLACVMQSVTEAAGTPFVKTFTFADNVENFPINGAYKADAAAFITFVKNSALSTAGDEVIMTAALSSMTLSCAPTEHDGQLWMSGDWLGRYSQDNQTYAGTLAIPSTYTYWNWHDLLSAATGFLINSTAVLPYGFSMAITNGLKFIPCNGPGTFGAQGIVCPYFSCTGYIDVLWDATARTIIGEEDTKTCYPVAIVWGANPATASGHLAINLNAKFMTHPTQGAEETIVRLGFKTVKAIATEPLSISMANGVDRGAEHPGGVWG